MKTDRNILIAFILNLGFSMFEFIGGTITNSIAIISDSIHDIGDSLSIGISYFLEKKSKRKPDDKYTYGYARFSVLGSLITTMILIIGSIFVIISAINRFINPIDINYNGMILIAVIGVIINFLAAYFTRDKGSLNQQSVNLHMLEDVLGWIIVLIGSIVMKFTNIKIIDSILSILVAIFIFISALKNLKIIIDLFLEKTPKGINITELKQNILKINGVKDIHHIHIWSLDGYNNYATIHIVVGEKSKDIKKLVREELTKHNIIHTTIELENASDECINKSCQADFSNYHNHKHHH